MGRINTTEPMSRGTKVRRFKPDDVRSDPRRSKGAKMVAMERRIQREMKNFADTKEDNPWII